jgi:RimJ/RimL family protein N-acetyltransferase
MTSPATQERGAEVAARYPRRVPLRGDRPVELRLMDAGDGERMLAFARALPADDLLFLRSNITEAPAVDGWIANIVDGRTFTVLGVDGDAIGGYASVHLNPAEWMRHVGEIRLLTGTDFRGAGLGRALASEIFAVASILGLRKLSAQMTLDQPGARATFERLGFKPEALLTDWVISTDGRTRDLLIMAYDVEGLTDTV